MPHVRYAACGFLLKERTVLLIKASHLTKYYHGVPAVKDVSFQVEDGSICAFLGPNGAGKSTTLKMLSGVLAPSEGEAEIGGFSVTDAGMKARARLGYLPENPPVYPELTVREHLSFAAELKGLSGAAAKRAVEEAEARLGLSDLSGRLTRNLSRGYRQRCAIAAAVLGSPEAVILDEPEAGLDPRQMTDVKELIREIGKSASVLVSSHHIGEIADLCDRIVILSDGEVAASGTPDELLSGYGDGAGERPVTQDPLLLRAWRSEALKGVFLKLTGGEDA